MSAETLRRAAALMRERAEACVSMNDPSEEPWYLVIDGASGTKWHSFANANPIDATHIASWHPSVALAVADWLADVAEGLDDAPESVTYAEEDKALAVARAYLGEAS